jgi:tetratricopeptide (TPR) repeat protein
MNIRKIRQLIHNNDVSKRALEYLIESRGECEHLDYKEMYDFENDTPLACLVKDIIAMKNIGGGYIVFGVKDKTWEPVGIRKESRIFDSKEITDKVIKASGLSITLNLIYHDLFYNNEAKLFCFILIRSSQKFSKLKTPSVCKKSFPTKTPVLREGVIYYRNNDQTQTLKSNDDLERLLYDLAERENSIVSDEYDIPSPFEIELGLYKLLNKEYDVFIGREDVTSAILNKLLYDDRIWIFDIYGPGGVGKSAIASYIARECFDNKRFDAILQLSAKDKSLDNGQMVTVIPSLYSLENLLEQILILFGFYDYIDSDTEKMMDIVLTLIADYSLLLVLDNMETVSDGRIIKFVQDLPVGSKTKVLLTTRYRTAKWEYPIMVESFNFEESKKLIDIKSKEMNISKSIDNIAYDIIFNTSGGLPLAIEWILGRYKQKGDWIKIGDEIYKSENVLLEFSFRKLWETLSNEEQRVMAILPLFESPPNLFMWSKVSLYPMDYLDKIADKLQQTSFITKITKKDGKEVFLALPITLSFARIELGKFGNLELEAKTRMEQINISSALIETEKNNLRSFYEKLNINSETEKQAIILSKKAEFEYSNFDIDAADDLFKVALDTEPRSVYVLIKYAQFKLEIGQIHDAEHLFNKAISFTNKTNGFHVYFSASKYYEKIKNFEKAADYTQKALQYDPTSINARHHLGYLYSRLNLTDKAITIFDALINDVINSPNPNKTSICYTLKAKLITLSKAKLQDELTKAKEYAKTILNKIDCHQCLTCDILQKIES